VNRASRVLADVAIAMALLLIALPVGAEDGDEDLDDILSGFDEPADASGDSGVDEALEGFDLDDEGGDGEADLDDVLGGFDTLDDVEETAPSGAGLLGDPDTRGWDLTGSVSVGSSVNFVSHRSARKNTNYKGLSRLRTRLNLQLEVDLPFEWKFQGMGYAWYDFAYIARGTSEYTQQVRNNYIWEADTQEVWIQGSVTEHLDLKIGRQVVNWGRSDSLRVVDVLNPLDQREPGLTDIEDLRRPVGMVRADYYWRNWSLTALAIPEQRFDKEPPPGSDFNPSPDLPPNAKDPISKRPNDFGSDTEWGFALTGIFQGWDFSINMARYTSNLGHLDSFEFLDPLSGAEAEIHYARLWMVGGGANYTIGSWLFKTEAAGIEGIAFTDQAVFDEQGMVVGVNQSGDRWRLDVMGGIEYYGFDDTTLSLEIAQRHIFDKPKGPTIESGFVIPQEDTTETAMRITRSFLNERLDVTLLGLVFGEKVQDGSIARLQVDYDIIDALVATAGVLLFQEGDSVPLDTWGDNDRFFFQLKYSF
jgi:hypothetical protein